MNKQRRKELNEIANKVADLQTQLQTIMEDEQEYYDNMPEGIQEGENGDAALDAISDMEAANCYFDDVQSSLNEAVE